MPEQRKRILNIRAAVALAECRGIRFREHDGQAHRLDQIGNAIARHRAADARWSINLLRTDRRPQGVGLCHRLSQLAAQLPQWLHRYNWHRPHGSLNSKPPISRLGLTEDNLLRLHI